MSEDSARAFLDPRKLLTPMVAAVNTAYQAALECQPMPPWFRNALILSGLALAWRINRRLTSRALNNAVDAKFDWSREIALVTGGAGGIGAEVVKKLARGGTRVIVLDVLPLTFHKAKNVFYYKCDLTNYEQLQSVAGRIKAEVGAPTVVVANAGICRGKPILQADKRDIELTFSVNNLAMLWTAKTFLPNMAEHNHGHFLIVASQTGYMATAGLTDYSATKAAAIAIYEGLHSEMRNMNRAPAVRVSCVSPSAVDTKMFSGIKLKGGMKSLTPEELGDAIVDVLRSGKAQHILVPRSAYLATPTRMLPDWLRVVMQDSAVGVFTDLKPHNPMADS